MSNPKGSVRHGNFYLRWTQGGRLTGPRGLEILHSDSPISTLILTWYTRRLSRAFQRGVEASGLLLPLQGLAGLELPWCTRPGLAFFPDRFPPSFHSYFPSSLLPFPHKNQNIAPSLRVEEQGIIAGTSRQPPALAGLLLEGILPT